MKVLTGYRSAVSTPGLGRVVAATLVYYLLAGMVKLALLLSAQHATGSYAVGGAVIGAYSVAVAVGAPWWGRVVDWRGPGPVLALTSVAQTTAFIGCMTAAATNAPPPLLIAAATAAGLLSPPSSAHWRASR